MPVLGTRWLSCLPNTCSWGEEHDLQHNLSCKKGEFVSLRINHLYHITENLIDQICQGVPIEPSLQTLSGKTFDSRSKNVRDEATLEITGRGFWTKYQIAFFDIRVFVQITKRHKGKSLQQRYRANKMEKKQKCNECIL